MKEDLQERIQDLETIVGVGISSGLSKSHCNKIEYLMTKIEWIEGENYELREKLNELAKHLGLVFTEKKYALIKIED